MKYGQAISQLRDIHMPEPVGLFPLPIGWWVALGLLICIMGGGYYFTRRYLRRMQRFALRELVELERRCSSEHRMQGGSATSAAAELSLILKRFAQVQFPNNPVAEFSGESWLTFLDYTGGKTAFRYGVGRNLLVWPYCEVSDEALADLLVLSKRWVNQNAYRRWRRVRL